MQKQPAHAWAGRGYLDSSTAHCNRQTGGITARNTAKTTSPLLHLLCMDKQGLLVYNTSSVWAPRDGLACHRKRTALRHRNATTTASETRRENCRERSRGSETWLHCNTPCRKGFREFGRSDARSGECSFRRQPLASVFINEYYCDSFRTSEADRIG
jgi:hypothetical protein